ELRHVARPLGPLVVEHVVALAVHVRDLPEGRDFGGELVRADDLDPGLTLHGNPVAVLVLEVGEEGIAYESGRGVLVPSDDLRTVRLLDSERVHPRVLPRPLG